MCPICSRKNEQNNFQEQITAGLWRVGGRMTLIRQTAVWFAFAHAIAEGRVCAIAGSRPASPCSWLSLSRCCSTTIRLETTENYLKITVSWPAALLTLVSAWSVIMSDVITLRDELGMAGG
jgi:hypothetical protein